MLIGELEEMCYISTCQIQHVQAVSYNITRVKQVFGNTLPWLRMISLFFEGDGSLLDAF